MTTHIASVGPRHTEIRVYRVEHEQPDSGADTYYWCCNNDGVCSRHDDSLEWTIQGANHHYHTTHEVPHV